MARSRVLKQDVLKNKIKTAVDQAERSWMVARDHDPDGECHLYFINPTKKERIGRLKVATTDPKRGWKLATHMRFEPRWSGAEARCFIRYVLSGLPILRGPFEMP